MEYRWPEDDLNMPKRPPRWGWRLLVATLAILVFVIVLRWPIAV